MKSFKGDQRIYKGRSFDNPEQQQNQQSQIIPGLDQDNRTGQVQIRISDITD